MPQECTKCNIIWSDKTLSDNSPQKGYEEETIEVCPICLSDMDLVNSDTVITYSKNPINGVITNDVTGNVWRRPKTAFEKETIKAWSEADVNHFYSIPDRIFTVADGTTCLHCNSKLPNHTDKCTLKINN